jgi:hypothetical protein
MVLKKEYASRREAPQDGVRAHAGATAVRRLCSSRPGILRTMAENIAGACMICARVP